MTKTEKHFIYQIKNVENKKVYIGVTNNPKIRKKSHFTKLSKQKHENQKMQSDFNKYGEESFVFSILHEVDGWWPARIKERELIQQSGVLIHGYNIFGKKTATETELLAAKIDEPLYKSICEFVDKRCITKTNWVREAIKEKAVRDGLL